MGPTEGEKNESNGGWVKSGEMKREKTGIELARERHAEKRAKNPQVLKKTGGRSERGQKEGPELSRFAQTA